MPFPIAHGLVGATVIALIHNGTTSKNAAAAYGVGAFLAVSPDFELFFVWVLGFRDLHSTLTHSILFDFLLTAAALA